MRKLAYLIVVIVALGLIIAGCIPTTPIVNLPPEITSTAVTSGEVGMKYTYDVEATDPNGDALTYSLITSPGGMVIDKDSGMITWTPAAATGVNVTVDVSDGILSATEDFIVNVTDRTPMEITVDPLTFKVGEPTWFTIKMTANDDLGKSVKAHFGWPTSGSEKIDGTLDIDVESDVIFVLTGDGFQTGVFTMKDATAKFRGTFDKAGSYTTILEVKTTDGDSLYSQSITIVVEAFGPVQNLTTSEYYDTIQAAIHGASTGETIEVMSGTYAPFTVSGKTNLTIQSGSTVIIEGAQSVATAYGDRDCVVFVKNSTNVVLDGLDIQGRELGTTNTKNYGVIYENTSGEINNCTVSPNRIGDMLSTAIGIWDGSDINIDTCTIENFGRVGMLIYNACTAEVLNSTIEGQVYSGEGEVCYGIEVEAGDNASQATIVGNEIYNCDNTFTTGPTWQSGGVYINGWSEYQDEADCTVIVENNDIHDNYSGIIVIKSLLSYAHFNDIYNNRKFGVESLPAFDDSTALFDALANWWGRASGPSGEGTGNGDAVSDNVDFDPWRKSPNF